MGKAGAWIFLYVLFILSQCTTPALKSKPEFPYQSTLLYYVHLSVDLSVSIRRPSKGHFKNFVGGWGEGRGGLYWTWTSFLNHVQETYILEQGAYDAYKSAPLSIQGFFAPGDSAFPSFDARWQTRHFSLYMFHPRKIWILHFLQDFTALWCMPVLQFVCVPL